MRTLPLLTLLTILCLATPNHALAADDFKPGPPVEAFLAENDLGKSAVMIASWEKLPAARRVALLEELSKHLAERTKLPIFNTTDIVVGSRLLTGQMKFGGHGQITNQDFFIAGGKAGWAIETLIDAASPAGILETMPDPDRNAAIELLKVLVRAYARGVEAASTPATDKP